MTPPVRRLVLTGHVIFSVGWLGLTMVLLTLGIEGKVTGDRFGYQAMRVLSDVLVIPVSLLAWSTGLCLALFTRWGLVRHWWVLVKFTLTTLAVGLSIFSLRPGIHAVAEHGSDGADGTNLIVAPSVALCLYTTMTVLSIYKPWGRTRWERP